MQIHQLKGNRDGERELPAVVPENQVFLCCRNCQENKAAFVVKPQKTVYSRWKATESRLSVCAKVQTGQTENSLTEHLSTLECPQFQSLNIYTSSC